MALCAHSIALARCLGVRCETGMSSSKLPEGLSDPERGLLRKSVRDFLTGHWPADTAVERAGNAQAVGKLWRDMAGLGLTSLGSDNAEVGLRETLLVFEELGRASCPAPQLGAVAANLALANRPSDAARALLDQL